MPRTNLQRLRPLVELQIVLRLLIVLRNDAERFTETPALRLVLFEDGFRDDREERVEPTAVYSDAREDGSEVASEVKVDVRQAIRLTLGDLKGVGTDDSIL